MSDLYKLCRNILTQEPSVSLGTRELAFRLLTGEEGRGSVGLGSDLPRYPFMCNGIEVLLDRDTLVSLKEMLEAGQKIQAIKLFREKTGHGLKDSKDFIDYFVENKSLKLYGGPCSQCGAALLQSFDGRCNRCQEKSR